MQASNEKVPAPNQTSKLKEGEEEEKEIMAKRLRSKAFL
jgi:hypothetical protein